MSWQKIIPFILILNVFLFSEARNNLDEELFVAVKSGSLEVVQSLIEKGADVNTKDEWKLTPLFYAVWKNKTDIISYLKKHGGIISNKSKLEKVFEAEKYIKEAALLERDSKIENSLNGYIKALKIYEKIFNNNHEEIALLLFKCATIYSKLKDYNSALSYHHKEVKINLELFGGMHKSTAISYGNIGFTYRNLNQFQEAILNFNNAIVILEKIDESNNLLNMLYRAIGDIYKMINNGEKALNFYSKAYISHIMLYGENNESVADILLEIGLVNKNKNNFKEANINLMKAHTIYEELLGKWHPKIAIVCEHLGYLNEFMKKYSTALDYFNKSLEVKKRILGEDDKLIAESFENIGRIYQYLGKPNEASDFLKRTLDMKIKLYGKNHIQVIYTLNSLGHLANSIGNHEEAIEHFLEALNIHNNISREDKTLVAGIYRSIGGVYNKLKKFDLALNYLNDALVIQKMHSINKPSELSLTYRIIKDVYARLDHKNKDLFYLKKEGQFCMKYFGENSLPVFWIYYGIAVYYSQIEDNSNALKYLNKSLYVHEKINPESNWDTGDLYFWIGFKEFNIDKYDDAMKNVKRALLIFNGLNKSNKNEIQIAQCYELLAFIYRSLNQKKLALQIYKNAYKIRQKIYKNDAEKLAHENVQMGSFYGTLGDIKSAKEHHLKALNLLLKNHDEDNIDVAYCYEWLGRALMVKQNFKEALEYITKAQKIYTKIFGVNHIKIAEIYGAFGTIYRHSKKYENALNAYFKALDIYEKNSSSKKYSIGGIYLAIGFSYELIGNHKKAISYLERCIEMFESIENKMSLSRAKFYLAGAYAFSENHENAIRELEESINIKDRIRFEIQDPTHKESFYEDYLDNYRLLIRMLMKKKKYNRAFIKAEQSKSVVFADMMAKKGARDNFAKKDSRFQDLLKEEYEILNKINKLKNLLKTQTEKSDLTKRMLINAQSQLSNLQDLMSKKYPSYSELSYPKEITVEEAKSFLKDDETYLSFYILSDYSVVFILTKNDFKVQMINFGKEYFQTKIPELKKQIKTCLNKLTLFMGGVKSAIKKKDYYPGLSKEFYKNIFQPVEKHIRTKKLIVSADGILYGFPLEALVIEQKEKVSFGGELHSIEKCKDMQFRGEAPLFSEYNSMTFLGDKYNIFYIPSLSTLKILRTETKTNVNVENKVIAFADPIFNDEDPRVKGTEKKATQLVEGQLYVNSNTVRSWPPHRLPETSEEAKIFVKEIGKGDVYVGIEANEKRVWDKELSDAKYILFSTHGILGTEIQRSEMIEPALVLSLVGNTEEYNGLLEMSEAAGLRLNSELVILAACNSAGESGKGGEGFAGLARSFIFAGTQGVIASHWKIESMATKNLISILGEMLSKNDRRQAFFKAREKFKSVIGKLKYFNICYAHPYFWSAFVYIGD